MVSEEALRYATQRIEDFAKVQAGRPNKQEALSIMFNSIGLDEHVKPQLFDWFDNVFPMVDDTSALLGLLLGFLILQYYLDEHGIQEEALRSL